MRAIIRCRHSRNTEVNNNTHPYVAEGILTHLENPNQKKQKTRTQVQQRAGNVATQAPRQKKIARTLILESHWLYDPMWVLGECNHAEGIQLRAKENAKQTTAAMATTTTCGGHGGGPPNANGCQNFEQMDGRTSERPLRTQCHDRFFHVRLELISPFQTRSVHLEFNLGSKKLTQIGLI